MEEGTWYWQLLWELSSRWSLPSSWAGAFSASTKELPYEQNFALHPRGGANAYLKRQYTIGRCVFCLYDRGFVHYGGL